MFFSVAGRKTPERRVRARGLQEKEARCGKPHALSQHRTPDNPQPPPHPPAPCRPRAHTRRSGAVRPTAEKNICVSAWIACGQAAGNDEQKVLIPQPALTKIGPCLVSPKTNSPALAQR